MEAVRVTGIGTYLPKTMHDNVSLPKLEVEPTQEELDKIGVKRRGWAGPDEGIADMAKEACSRALAKANVKPSELDFIVLANWTQRRYIPEHAPKLQALLGAPQAFAYDVSTACCGFAYGVAMAHSFLQNPRFLKGLVVASETTSQRGRPTSKATLVFGDASGAFVVQKGVSHGTELIDYELLTVGTEHHIMDISPEGWVRTHIKQQELIMLTQRCIGDVTSKILKRNGMTLNDVRWIVPHSGTAGVQAALIRSLEVPKEKVLTNFAEIGNVSSAAIPLALSHFIDRGTIKPGDLVLSPAVGTGFYGAALLYRVGA